MRVILIFIAIFMLSDFGISFAQTNTQESVANEPTPLAAANVHEDKNDKAVQPPQSNHWDKDIVVSVATVLAVIVGWTLGVGTDFIRKKLEVRRIKKAIIQELEDCLSWLLRNKLTVEHLVQLLALKQPLEYLPVPVPTHIYKNHFASVSIFFNKNERVSINAIHNLIQYAEKQSEQLETLFKQKPGLSEANDKALNSTLGGLYTNIDLAIIQIRFHLKHKETLDVSKLNGEVMQGLDKNQAARIRQLIEEARALGPDGIKNKYYKT